jgi:hypothetical protein
MKINKAMNIVVPVDIDGVECFVHSTPISFEVFEKYFLVISKTFSEIYSQGLSHVAAPRVAGLLLKKCAKDLGELESVEKGLINEIRRLTNIVMPSDKGWETIPYYDALQQKLINNQDASEVDNVLVYFTCCGAMHRKENLSGVLGLLSMWGVQTTLLNSTEYTHYLPTSTEVENFGEMEIISLVPS